VLYQIQRREQIARLNDKVSYTIRQSARVYPFQQFQPSSLTSFMRERRVQALFHTTPANWQETFVGKSDLAVKGENDGRKQRRRERDGARRRWNKNKRREAI